MIDWIRYYLEKQVCIARLSSIQRLITLRTSLIKNINDPKITQNEMEFFLATLILLGYNELQGIYVIGIWNLI